MTTTTKVLALAVSGAFALSIAATTVNAASNPFAAKSLSSGYMVAEADTEMKDSKCGTGTGKCSASKKKAEMQSMEKSDEMKPMEKSAEGSCKAGMKMQDGSCNAGKAK